MHVRRPYEKRKPTSTTAEPTVTTQPEEGLFLPDDANKLNTLLENLRNNTLPRASNMLKTVRIFY